MTTTQQPDTAPPDEAPSPSKRRNLGRIVVGIFSWTLRGLLLVLALALLTVVVALSMLPDFVEERLAEAGLPGTQVARIHVGLFGLDLLDTTVSNGSGAGLSATRISVRFRPERVQDGQIDSLRIEGAALRLVQNNGEWQIDGIPDLQAMVSNGQNEDAAPTPPKVPVSCVSLRDCTAEVLSPEAPAVTVHVDGELRPLTTSQFLFDGSLRVNWRSKTVANIATVERVRLRAGVESSAAGVQRLVAHAKLSDVSLAVAGKGVHLAKLELRDIILPLDQGDTVTPVRTEIALRGLVAGTMALPELFARIEGTTEEIRIDVPSLSTPALPGVLAEHLRLTLARTGKNGLRVEAGGTLKQNDNTDSPLPPETVAEFAIGPATAPVPVWLSRLRTPQTLRDGAGVAGRVKVQVPEFQVPGVAATVSDIESTVPFVWRGGKNVVSPEGTPFEVRCASVTYGDVDLPGGRMQGHLAGTQAKVTITPLDDAGELPFDASAQVSADWAASPKITAELSVRTSQLEAVADFASRFRPLSLPPGLSYSGTVSCTARVGWRANQGLSPIRAMVRLSDGRIEREEPRLLLTGVNTELVFEDALAARSALHQELSFGAAIIGNLPVDGGILHYAVEGADQVFLEHGTFQWCGGRVITHAVRFRPSMPNLSLTLFADGVELAQLFELQDLMPGSATGRLYGKIPIEVREGNVSLGQGYLYSPPGQTGQLALEDTEVLFGQLPDTDPRIGQAKKALSDMEYTYLRFDLNGEDMTAPLSIRVFGNSRTNPNLPPVKLNTNIEANINDILDVTRAMKRLNLQF